MEKMTDRVHDFKEDNIEVDEKVRKGIIEKYLGFRLLTAVSLVPSVLVISTTVGASIPANNLFQEIFMSLIFFPFFACCASQGSLLALPSTGRGRLSVGLWKGRHWPGL